MENEEEISKLVKNEFYKAGELYKELAPFLREKLQKKADNSTVILMFMMLIINLSNQVGHNEDCVMELMKLCYKAID